MNLTYDGYRMVFYIGLGLTILFLLVTVALFFVFKVPEIIGDLTGRTADKAIKEIRGNSVKTGVSSGTSSSKKGSKKKSKAPAPKKQSAPVQPAPETSVLGDVQGNETAVLADAPQSVGQETAVLGSLPADQASQETAVLSNAPVAAAQAPKVPQTPQKPVQKAAAPVIEKKKKTEKAAKSNKDSVNGGANKMYMPINGNNSFVNDAETSELLDMAAPSQVEFYGPNDNPGNLPPYRVFVIEYDMTFAESTEIIP